MRISDVCSRFALTPLTLAALLSGSTRLLASSFVFAGLSYPGASFTRADGITNDGTIFGLAGEPYESEFVYHVGAFGLTPGLVSVSKNGTILSSTTAGPIVQVNEVGTPLGVPGLTVVAVNNSGTVLGYLAGQGAGLLIDSTFYPVNVPGSVLTSVSGLNDLGEVVGSYITSTGVSRGFIYQGGTYAQISFPGAISSRAYAINNADVIVATTSSGRVSRLVFRGLF